MLHRYWFIIHPQDRFGPRNFGVTANSIQEAKTLIKDIFNKLQWSHITDELLEQAEIIDNIDIRFLDENHVIPNMGIVPFHGVWFPNCNS